MRVDMSAMIRLSDRRVVMLQPVSRFECYDMSVNFISDTI